jgi:hypothetical protein
MDRLTGSFVTTWIPDWLPVSDAVATSVTVIVCVPTVFSVMAELKMRIPASALVKG